jgi:hypothetical protein
VSQTLAELQTANYRHDRGRDHEQVTGHRDTGEECPGLEYVSEDGACEHPRPKGQDESMDYAEEDESPFNLPEDSPPALYNAVSETHEE